ncbi:putative integral membrane protein (TIGR00698 family) [Povalibacter uvarum]|uniref:Putative integral membrane protein (TIGR00698 family) n=1 Tax=Povalibacter uvarum TaxID=732238 RepID=A0A841HWJ2_9GAMM|nr:putative sulfate exporter family transporter [Povalibacter uvarum]MBB6096322.1 putative integral membrane protein (TIGR00698 family) [Povalibacter uvarum]
MVSTTLSIVRDAMVTFPERSRELLPGLTVTAIVAAAATFLADHYQAPLMLFALLLGIAMNFLSGETRCAAGIDFSARAVLRTGVALLGVRVTFDQIAQLGWQPPVIVIVSLVVTIGVSTLLARWMRFHTLFGFLTGGATAICGASAALALSAALPAHPGKEKATTFTVIGVSALSTIAMIVYPLIAHLLDLSPAAAGLFIGGTIHDVAQVVGAGYSMSQETGDVATVVKLMRVAMLLPVIVCAAMITRAQGDGRGTRPPLLPWFAVAFVALAAFNSLGWIGSATRDVANDVSRWCLAIAMSAIGMKTQLKELAAVGLKPVILMVIETVLLACLVLGLSHWLG